MGKFTDLVIAVIVLVIGVWILTKLNLTAGQIWNMFWKFFGTGTGSSSSTNATSGLILGMGITNSQLRSKMKDKREMLLRAIRISQFGKSGNIILRKIRGH